MPEPLTTLWRCPEPSCGLLGDDGTYCCGRGDGHHTRARRPVLVFSEEDMKAALEKRDAWRRRYEESAKDANEVYGIAFGMLNPEGGDLDIAGALNELQQAAKRMEAREVFVAGGLDEAGSSEGHTLVPNEALEAAKDYARFSELEAHSERTGAEAGLWAKAFAEAARGGRPQWPGTGDAGPQEPSHEEANDA